MGRLTKSARILTGHYREHHRRHHMMNEDGEKEIVVVQNARAIDAGSQKNRAQHYADEYVNRDAQMRQSLRYATIHIHGCYNGTSCDRSVLYQD